MCVRVCVCALLDGLLDTCNLSSLCQPSLGTARRPRGSLEVNTRDCVKEVLLEG